MEALLVSTGVVALAEMGDMLAEGAVAFSDDGHGVQDSGTMRRVMDYARGLDATVVCHCEDESLVGKGVVNVYGAAILRFPLAYESFNLRATVNLGASYLLMDLFGAPAGSLGIYAGVSPAGLEWKLSRAFILIINPLCIALPVPQLRGVPLTYPQYRMSIGLEVYRG